MKKILPYILTIVISLGLSYVLFSGAKEAAPIAAKESAYDRVMRTGLLRCGYITSPPYLIKDVNTGIFSGIAYDFMQEIAKDLGLKVEYVEETGWGTFATGLNADRYDMMCTTVWQSGTRARAALLTTPAYYNGLFAFAREGDNRFPTLESINNPEITVTVIDNDITQSVRRMMFPKAKELALQEIEAQSLTVLSVVERKTDVTLELPERIAMYNSGAESGKRLEAIENGKPVRVFANVFAVKNGEHDLLAMINSTLQSILTSGTGQRIIDQYSGAVYVDPPTKNQ